MLKTTFSKLVMAEHYNSIYAFYFPDKILLRVS